MKFLPFFSLLCMSAAVNSAPPCHNLDTQLEMNECASQQFELAEKKLNITYKKVLAQLEEHRVSTFKQAQANWQNYRKAECMYQASAYKGGSIYPLIYANCLEQLTTQRRSDLSQKQTPN